MLNVHRQMHLAKMMKDLRGDDVLDYVVRSTISEGKILCFDEFQVTDVADALILKRLFTGLINNGTIIVATSNRSPGDLYKNGLQRDLFLPFIDLLEEKCVVVGMWESEVDYRLIGNGLGDNAMVQDEGATPSFLRRAYFADDDPVEDGRPSSAKKSFLELFHALTRNSIVDSMVLDVNGRQMTIPQVSEKHGIARFSFDDLCRTAKGAADYLAICERFNTIFIEDVPRLMSHETNLVRRWITLVDALYECRTRVIIHAATDPERMFRVDLDSAHDEGFAFDRTRSRMEEMRSGGYLKKKWVGSK
jgi:predicted ATPase